MTKETVDFHCGKCGAETTIAPDPPAKAVSSSDLSTPVYKHLNGIESWDSADENTRIDFYGAMKGRAYGREPTLDAWNWFLIGRQNLPYRIVRKVNLLTCCKCGQRTRKFVCPKCEHRLCGSCK